ncbi:MAG TPA: polyamine aminopropyltransferase [Burkholderiaceae bacterium]|nr:polyamine aminopropyltransferase [Burkholderiaceae bacterium]
MAPGEAALLACVFVVAACGLVYELSAGALASYLLGDSVLQFSTVIGTYLFAMGLGSWASRHVREPVSATFVEVELIVGLVGGLMPAALFASHAWLPAGSVGAFRTLMYLFVTLVGMGVGLEIPLVLRLVERPLRGREAIATLVSQVLTFDYLGALVVSIAFPLLLVPHLGLVRSGVFFGLLNALVALWSLLLFRRGLGRAFGALAVQCGLVIAVLAAAYAGGERLTSWAEDSFYGTGVVLREDTPYQRIVITSQDGVARLFLNGNLQFNSKDEYRYHEALVHPAMAGFGAPRRVLVLGGGDGMALREVLRYPSVEQVTQVELDPEMTRLFSKDPMLVALNRGALLSSKLRLVNADAYIWLEQHQGEDEQYDVVIIDFPDPSNYALGKLYSTSFYALVDQHLAASGYAVVQTTSPLIARRSFWTVVTTLEAVGFGTVPYHVHVPSFGEWGFVIASRRPWVRPRALPPGLKFLTLHGIDAMLDFPLDMARVPAEPNRLSNQTLVRTFEEEWGRVHE